MQVIIDTLLTNYESTGTGKVVLLLHGWGDSHETFARLASALAENYQVVRLDLPGFGKTEPPKEPWNLNNYARFLKEFLKKLNLVPYAVIGHSNGGALAIHAIAQ